MKKIAGGEIIKVPYLIVTAEKLYRRRELYLKASGHERPMGYTLQLQGAAFLGAMLRVQKIDYITMATKALQKTKTI